MVHENVKCKPILPVMLTFLSFVSLSAPASAKTNEVVSVTLTSGRVCTMARPAEGRPAMFFAHGEAYRVYHDGSYTNVTAELKEKARKSGRRVYKGRRE